MKRIPRRPNAQSDLISFPLDPKGNKSDLSFKMAVQMNGDWKDESGQLYEDPLNI